VVDQTDFIDLYRKLRLEADCTLAEFKQAYRRHVAQWHPDRRRGTRADALAAARLQRLTAQYSAAMDFHKRHGRLPGAAGAPRVHPMAVSPVALDRTNGSDETAPVTGLTGGGQAPSARAMPTRWMMIGGTVCAAILVWSFMPVAASPPDDDAIEVAAAVPHAARVVPGGSLSEGMNADAVMAVEGEPTRRGEDHWEYGPSWIRFDGGAVSDWYSSPLRPLHTASARATH
jgi:hypothetical protein